MNAWTRLVTDEKELAGINPVIVEQARVRAAEKNVTGWLFALEQPTYVAVMTDGDSETLRRDFYEAWSTRASEVGPSAGKFDNTAGHGPHPLAAPRSRPAARFPQLRRLCAGDAHGAVQPGGVRFPSRAGARRAAGREARVRGARSVRRPPAERLGRELLRREAAGEALLHLAGRAAAVLPAAARARRPVLGGREAVRREDRRAQGRAAVSPRRALLRDSRCQRRGARRLLSRRLRARQETRRRVDGRLRRPQGLRRRPHRAGGLPGVQFPARRARQAARCSRTTTS